MKELDVPVTDLYALCMKDEHRYKSEDRLHLNSEGNKRCAKQVAEFIRKYAE